LLKFEPLYINDWDDYGLPNLPSNVDTHDPFELFNLFFIDKIMDKLIEWTNKHAELYPPNKEKEHLCVWQLTCKQELWAYFAVLIYMGITIESCIKDYWKSLDAHSCEHIIKKYIGLKRFQQLNRHF